MSDFYPRPKSSGVLEVTEKYFLAYDGSRHTSYGAAHTATITHKLAEAIRSFRGDGWIGPDKSNTDIAEHILRNFVVTLPR